MIVGCDPGQEQTALLAYMAGLVDGEGCVLIKRRNPIGARRSPRYSVFFSIAMTDRAPVAVVARYLGAENLIVERDRPGCKRIYQFDIEHERATWFLKSVSPFVIGKAQQIEMALRLAELRAVARAHRTKVTSTGVFKAGRAAGHQYQSRGLSDEYIAECDALYLEIKKLNPRAGQAGAWGSR